MITDLFVAYVWLPGESKRRVFAFLDLYDPDAFVNRVRGRCRVESATRQAYELHTALEDLAGEKRAPGAKHVIGDGQGA